MVQQLYEHMNMNMSLSIFCNLLENLWVEWLKNIERNFRGVVERKQNRRSPGPGAAGRQPGDNFPATVTCFPQMRRNRESLIVRLGRCFKSWIKSAQPNQSRTNSQWRKPLVLLLIGKWTTAIISQALEPISSEGVNFGWLGRRWGSHEELESMYGVEHKNHMEGHTYLQKNSYREEYNRHGKESVHLGQNGLVVTWSG